MPKKSDKKQIEEDTVCLIRVLDEEKKKKKEKPKMVIEIVPVVMSFD